MGVGDRSVKHSQRDLNAHGGACALRRAKSMDRPASTIRAVCVLIAILYATAVFTAMGLDEAADRAVQLARDALAKHSTSAAELVDVVAVNWPDSSLGCPTPGLVYTPAVVAGHRVRFKLNGTIYAVHVGEGRAVVCGAPGNIDREPSAVGRSNRDSGEAIAGLKLAQQAQRNLAAKLGVPADRVAIVFYRPASWPDAGLGCAAPGVSYPPQVTNGFRIQLRASDQTYEFHSDRSSRLIECPPPDKRR
jgi:hypothetical protein